MLAGFLSDALPVRSMKTGLMDTSQDAKMIQVHETKLFSNMVFYQYLCADIKRLFCRVRKFLLMSSIFVSCSLLLKFMGVNLLLVLWMALSDSMMFARLKCKHFALI